MTHQSKVWIKKLHSLCSRSSHLRRTLKQQAQWPPSTLSWLPASKRPAWSASPLLRLRRIHLQCQVRQRYDHAQWYPRVVVGPEPRAKRVQQIGSVHDLAYRRLLPAWTEAKTPLQAKLTTIDLISKIQYLQVPPSRLALPALHPSLTPARRACSAPI